MLSLSMKTIFYQRKLAKLVNNLLQHLLLSSCCLLNKHQRLRLSEGSRHRLTVKSGFVDLR